MNADAMRVQLSEGQKLGLALSGGGFRAAFFHVGVLAQLARQGLLRHVQVISTVSGGSIIGALYYLHVRSLLETKADEFVEDADYVRIMEKIETDFLHGVQLNLRVLIFADAGKVWRMRLPEYSTSDRLGELYDEHFYQPATHRDSGRMLRMKDLKIWPMLPDGKRDTAFNPDTGNASRKAKVPILVLNATSLNSGRNWRFEAARMGEPPMTDAVACDVDKNLRLLRAPSYDDVTPLQQDMELGMAVAASACVPGVFHPLAVSGLYDGVRIQLVDGGVHDNQGVQGLLENRCNLMIVSDACGQMGDEAEPYTWMGAALKRSNDILMARVRQEQLFHLMEDENPSVAFFHLRQGLKPRTAPWIAADGAPTRDFEDPCGPESKKCSFGVDAEVQRLLSKVRTDLDSFTDVEAFSLMADGYVISEEALLKITKIQEALAPEASLPGGEWRFLGILPWMENPTRDYLKQIKTSGSLFFKVFLLNARLMAAAVGIITLLVLWGLIAGGAVEFQLKATLRGILIAAAVAAAALFLPRLARTFEPLKFLISPMQTVASWFGQALAPLVVSRVMKIHLKLFDPLYLKMGKVDRLSKPK